MLRTVSDFTFWTILSNRIEVIDPTFFKVKSRLDPFSHDPFSHKERTISRSRSGCEYDGNFSWLVNAEKENQRYLFKAILAKNNPNNNPNILLSDKIGGWPDNLWAGQSSMVVNRNTQAMMDALTPLLQKADEIIFVDPYFRASEPRFREPFISLLRESVNCSAYPSKNRIELHVSSDYYKSQSNDEFQRECDRWLPAELPCGLALRIKRWSQRPGHDKLHNRYILTNLGGVQFGIGLDTGKTGESDDISLLGREQFTMRWQQYTGNDSEFELGNKFTIQGKR